MSTVLSVVPDGLFPGKDTCLSKSGDNHFLSKNFNNHLAGEQGEQKIWHTSCCHHGKY